MATTGVQRLNIGIFYQNDEAWIGGTYYLLNLVQALKVSDDYRRPIITVLSSNIADFEQLKKLTDYPFLEFANTAAEPPTWKRIFNRLARPILRKNLFETRPRLDAVFPLRGQKYLHFTALCKQRICWIPDFQEEFLPHLFDAADLADRRNSHQYTAKNMPHLVLSSQAAAADFAQFYGDIAKCKVHVLPFAVTHEQSYKELNINDLCKKYDLPKAYYFAPNQFWAHKNHWAILKAMAQLKAEGSEVVMVFSGKEMDYRKPEHVDELKAFVKKEGLEKQVRFLGFIDRQEQLALMLHAKAVVQASLFEGWSTVVEDAKAMNQFLIVSDLAVHREQLALPNEAVFFEPQNSAQLATLLASHWQTEKPTISRKYEENIKEFGENFILIIRQMLQEIGGL